MKEVYFKVNTEYISEVIFDMYIYENKSYSYCEKLIMEMLIGLSDAEARLIANKILTGKKMLKGIYPDEDITLKDAKREEEFFKAVRNQKINTEDSAVKETISKYKDVLYSELDERILTDLPSYKCNHENHNLDNSILFAFTSIAEIKSFERARNVKILGFCKNPELPKKNCYAVVYEDTTDFETHWCHIVSYMVDRLREQLQRLNKLEELK